MNVEVLANPDAVAQKAVNLSPLKLGRLLLLAAALSSL